MKFTIAREPFAAALKLAAEVATPKTFPLLLNVRLEATKKDGLVTTSTDGDIRLVDAVAECEVKKPGVMLLPAKLLADIVADLAGDAVTVEYDGSTATVSAAGDHYELPTSDPADWPQAADDPEAPTLQAPEAELARALASVAPFAADFGDKYAYKSVCVIPDQRGAMLVATDGRTCAWRRVDGVSAPVEFQVLIPPALGKLMAKLLDSQQVGNDATLSMYENRTVLSAGARRLSGQSVYGQHPDTLNYLRALCEQPGQFKAAHGALANAMVRARHMSTKDGATHGVRFELGRDLLVLRSATPGKGKAEIRCDVAYQGEPIVFGLSPDYVLKALGVFDRNAEVVVQFFDKDHTLLFHQGVPMQLSVGIGPIEV